MARTHKIGIDYFSHDVDMCQDMKMRIIIAKYGLDGYGVFNRLLEDIYRDKGYYLKVDEDYNILFSNDNNLDIDVYINILNDLINRGLFNKELYNEYNILTSKRTQMNYIEATKRRSKVDFLKEYLLVEEEYIEEMYSNKVDVNIIRINVDINSLNDDISTQRKVKRKEIESKEKEKDNNDANASEKFDYKGIYDFYLKLDNLVNHQKYTKAMKTAMEKARKELSLDKLEMMDLLKKHNLLVGLTKNNPKYKVRPRRLDVFFGQKIDKTSGSPLICAEYQNKGTKAAWLKTELEKSKGGSNAKNKVDNKSREEKALEVYAGQTGQTIEQARQKIEEVEKNGFKDIECPF